MQGSFCKVVGKVLKLWERFYRREKVGKVSKFQERLYNDNFKAGKGRKGKGKGKESSYISKNPNLYPHQSRITFHTLLWDTLYVITFDFIIWLVHFLKLNEASNAYIQGLKFPLNFSSVHCTGMYFYLILSDDNSRLATCSETIAKTILSSYAADFLQICANL